MKTGHAAGLAFVLALHAAVLYGLWSARVITPPAEAMTLFVNFIEPAPPPPKPRVVPPPRPSMPVKREKPTPVKPPHYHLASNAPVVSPAEAVEPLPPSSPVIEAPPEPVASPPAPPEPVTLASELAVTCPERSPPSYPPLSRRLGETGKVVLRVELDEAGRVSGAQVLTSSGFGRLDAAALAAVRTWRCQPSERDGRAVRSMAMQPFKFTLEGR